MNTLAGWQETVDTYRRLEHDVASVSVDGLAALVAELRAWRVVGEMAKRHECGADYQRTVWAAINAIDERARS